MFIFVAYKDPPELSTFRRQSSDEDLAEEKTLLVNPNCPVRVMLEYIRKQCKLAAHTQFDLCDEGGTLKGLFGYPTFAYTHQQFEHKRLYYLIVLYRPISLEPDKAAEKAMIFPQVNRDNKLYVDLQARVKRSLTGEPEPGSVSAGKSTPASKKK